MKVAHESGHPNLKFFFQFLARWRFRRYLNLWSVAKQSKIRINFLKLFLPGCVEICPRKIKILIENHFLGTEKKNFSDRPPVHFIEAMNQLLFFEPELCNKNKLYVSNQA